MAFDGVVKRTVRDVLLVSVFVRYVAVGVVDPMTIRDVILDGGPARYSGMAPARSLRLTRYRKVRIYFRRDACHLMFAMESLIASRGEGNASCSLSRDA